MSAGIGSAVRRGGLAALARTASRSTGTYGPSVCGAEATHARRCVRSRTTECEAIDASMALRFPGLRSFPSGPRRSRRMATADGTSSDPPALSSRTSRRVRLFRDVDPGGRARAKRRTAGSSASFVAPSEAPEDSRTANAEGLFSTTASRPALASPRRIRSDMKTFAARRRGKESRPPRTRTRASRGVVPETREDVPLGRVRADRPLHRRDETRERGGHGGFSLLAARVRHADRLFDDRAIPPVVLLQDENGEDRCARNLREAERPDGKRGGLPEERHVEAGAGHVPVALDRDARVLFERLAHREEREGRRVDRKAAHAEHPARVLDRKSVV